MSDIPAHMARFWQNKRATWEELHNIQGSPTIDIRRVVTTGEKDYLMKPGSEAEVPGLTGIRATVSPAKKKREEVLGKGIIETTQRKVVVWDTEILMTDQIIFNGVRYPVIGVQWNSAEKESQATIRVGGPA